MVDLIPAAEQPPQPFVWGAGGAQMTPERIAAARKVAQAMQATGMDFSPIRSPFQGVARVAQALMGAYDERKANEAENANAAADKAMVSSWFGGGAPAAAAAPASAPTVAATSAPAAPTVLDAGGQPAVADAQGVYGADAVMVPQGAPSGGPDYSRAIASIETGGQANPYATIGPANGKGQRPIGKYQVMDFNVPSWTKEVLGQEMTPQAFAASPEAQEAVFKNKFGQYVAQTGNPQDAASMWFTGRPLAEGANRRDVLGTTGQSYVERFTKNLGQQPPAVAAADPAALPPNATPAQGYAIPGQPAAPGVQAVSGALQGVNPGVVAAMQSPYTSDATKKIAALILQHQMGDKVTYQTLPDGTILQMDPNGKLPPKPVYQAPVKPELKDTGTDPITGQKTYEAYDAKTNSWIPIGRPAGSAAGPQGMLAPGVTAVDHNLKGDDYLNQYGSEVKAAVKAYINGDVMPTGNPRLQTLADNAKKIALKYGADMNIPVSDELYSAKRKMMTDLASSSANSSGGIISNGKSAFEHLTNLSDKFVDLGNANGPDVPGGSHVASVSNIVGNVIAPSSTTKGKVAAVNDNALKYGQESTKFYAGSGGGEGERMFALKNLNPERTSGNEQASFLQTEKELMLGRLRQKEAQIRDTLGQSYLDRHPVMTPDLTDTLKKLDDNILKLRGQGTPTATAAEPAPKLGDEKQFKQGTGVWDGTKWVPKAARASGG